MAITVDDLLLRRCLQGCPRRLDDNQFIPIQKTDGVRGGVQDSNVNVEIIPGVIRVLVEAPMTVSRDEQTQSFRSFDVALESKMYDLLEISGSIIDFESTYGNTETMIYQLYYPDLNIYKDWRTEGSTIYTVKDVTTGEMFTFASRSLAWDGGYGID